MGWETPVGDDLQHVPQQKWRALNQPLSLSWMLFLENRIAPESANGKSANEKRAVLVCR